MYPTRYPNAIVHTKFMTIYVAHIKIAILYQLDCNVWSGEL